MNSTNVCIADQVQEALSEKHETGSELIACPNVKLSNFIYRKEVQNTSLRVVEL